MHARGARPLWQTLACAALRVAYNGVTTVFFIWVIAGGLPAYAGTYDSVLARIPGVPAGPLAALVVTALVIVGWAAAASVIQVQIFGRVLRRWPVVGATAAPAPAAPVARPSSTRFDARAVALCATIAFALLLAGSGWWLVGGVAAWLLAAWALTRPIASRSPPA